MNSRPFLSDGQLLVLRSLADRQPTTVAETAAELKLTNKTVTVHVRSLVAKGLVSRGLNPQSASRSHRPILTTTEEGSQAAKTGAMPEVPVVDKSRIAQPQRISYHGTYYEPVVMEPVRPGANDHLNYKSRTSA